MTTEHPTFEELGLRPEIVSALATLGYEEPTPIQRASIPVLLQGRDLLGQAATGTGKTAAFALPTLQRISAHADKAVAPRALILVPTRELAMQVAEAVHKYGRALGVRVLPDLRRPADVSAAPRAEPRRRRRRRDAGSRGRSPDARNPRPLESIEVAVLDEADEMLDMGFAEDLEAILGATPETRQTALFSATMPRRILGSPETPARSGEDPDRRRARRR
jgi:ATP-dependent RNA helicase DeaD